MIKKIVILITVIMIFLSFGVVAADSYGGYKLPVDIEINGHFIKCVHKPIISGGTTYIPLRAFSDAIGGEIKWDNEESAAKMKKSGHTFVFYPEKEYCIIDGEKKDYSSVIYKNLTFIPVRAVSEALGYDVFWEEEYLTVKISAPDIYIPRESRDYSYSYEDIKCLSKIIQIESGYEHFKAKLGVAGTVVNRVKSSQFPNTVKDVIFDTKYGVQFPPAHTDLFNNTPSKESVIAAKCALNGVNLVGNSLYFTDKRNASSTWVHRNREHYCDIYGMSFYK